MALRSFVQGLFCIFLGNIIMGVNSQVLTSTVPSYAPVSTECPSAASILRLAGSPTQQNQTLSQGEQDFLRGRRSAIAPLWRKFFTTGPGKATGYDFISQITDQNNPILGIAHSGGGLRASLYGAGVVQALDSNTCSSPIRGVYQLASYAVGLSGGSWVVASMAANDHPPVSELVSRWQLDKDLVLPGGLNVLKSTQFLDQLYDTTKLKEKSGYDISITDLWGRALGYHILPGTTSANFFTNSPSTAHGAGMLMSGLRNTKSFQEFQSPFPILVSDHKPLNQSEINPSSVQISGATYIPLSAPVYETSPVEFGSFEPQLSAFIPTEFLGTSLASGKPFIPASVNKASKPDPKQTCVRGFDQLSFVMGSSASLFNAIAEFPIKYKSILVQLINKISGSASDKSLTARYPNPFKGVNGQSRFDRTDSDELVIVDGGENGENLPFSPLLAPARQVDVILAADASADSKSSDPRGAGWPLGSSMINTFLRVHQVLPPGAASFPPVPLDPKIWEDKRFSSRPTFFGCDAPSNKGNGGYPLIIYLPNSSNSQSGFSTNTSTFKLQYSTAESSLFLQAVMNSTIHPMIEVNKVDTDWPTCLSCGLIDRTRNRLGVPQSEACKTCFKRYCYFS